MSIAEESRRANLIWGTVLIVVGLLLSAYSSHHPQFVKSGNLIITSVQRPVLELFSGLTQKTGNFFEAYFELWGVREENADLHKKLSVLTEQNLALQALRKENEQLSALVEFRKQSGLGGVAASVVGYNTLSLSRSIIIDRGWDSGLETGQAVVSGSSLVGQVMSVSSGTAEVLLIDDASSGVDVFSQDARFRGVVKGSGRGLELAYVARGINLNIGEQIVTSGMDARFPKGLLVGIIRNTSEVADSQMFVHAEVAASVNLDNLEIVYVISGNKK